MTSRTAGHGAEQRDRAPTTADLGPTGPSRVVRLAPDQGDAGRDEHGRPEIRPGRLTEVHVADEDHGHDDHEEEGDHLAAVGLAGHEPAAAVQGGLGGDGRGPLVVDAAHAERDEEPERRVDQRAEAVRQEEAA